MSPYQSRIETAYTKARYPSDTPSAMDTVWISTPMIFVVTFCAPARPLSELLKALANHRAVASSPSQCQRHFPGVRQLEVARHLSSRADHQPHGCLLGRYIVIKVGKEQS
jgi:hypothetical protein